MTEHQAIAPSEAISPKELVNAVERMREAVKHARLAYQFGASSYTASAFQNCLAAAEALDQYVSNLAFAHSAEWLRTLPKIIERDDLHDGADGDADRQQSLDLRGDPDVE